MASPDALAALLDEQPGQPAVSPGAGGMIFGVGRRPTFASMYPTVGMNTPPLPSASAPWYGEQPGIVAKMLMGARDTLMQANQAMPWGGNDPSAVGIDPQAGTMDPNVMVPFASNVAGYATTGSMAGPAVQDGLGMGIRAYHGSPHDFDRFSMDKIGTGEGAQAYGHGLYFAEREGVARSYRDALAKDNMSVVGLSDGARKWLDGMMAEVPDATLADMEDYARNLYDPWDADSPKSAISNEIIDALQAGEIPSAPNGRMYEVDINASPDEFLDWDKPLSEQPEAIQNAIKSTETYKHYLAGNEAGRMQHPDTYPGSRWISFLQDEAARVDEAMSAPLPSALPDSRASWRSSSTSGPNVASEILRGKGIKGIRYKDAGSRTQSDQPFWKVTRKSDGVLVTQVTSKAKADDILKSGDFLVEGPFESGTSNYVVFDDNIINILKKYGLAGLTAGGGAAAMLGGGSDPASASAPTYTTGGRF